MNTKAIIGSVAAVLVLILIGTGMYTVEEGQRALVLRLGELVKNSDTGKAEVMKPGLHFKVPFITRAYKFNVRLQTVDVQSSRILTEEQKYVLVDYYAKWRISDLSLYYKRTGGRAVRAQELLKQKINDALRAAFGRRTIKEVVSGDRLNIMNLLKGKANQSAKGLGIKVIDVRIRGIDLPKEVRESVFKRMSTQREQVATKHRAQGRAKAESVRASADATVAVEIATAKQQAQNTRARGDREAAEIYNHAYKGDAKFYALYRSLQAYRKVFYDHDTIMVLSPDSEFFKYFHDKKGK